jgi:hypothetical protein
VVVTSDTSNSVIRPGLACNGKIPHWAGSVTVTDVEQHSWMEKSQDQKIDCFHLAQVRDDGRRQRENWTSRRLQPISRE